MVSKFNVCMHVCIHIYTNTHVCFSGESGKLSGDSKGLCGPEDSEAHHILQETTPSSCTWVYRPSNAAGTEHHWPQASVVILFGPKSIGESISDSMNTLFYSIGESGLEDEGPTGPGSIYSERPVSGSPELQGWGGYSKGELGSAQRKMSGGGWGRCGHFSSCAQGHPRSS